MVGIFWLVVVGDEWWWAEVDFFGWCEMVISAFLSGDGWWWVYFG